MKIIVLISLIISSMHVVSNEIPIDLRVNNFYEALIMSFHQKYLAKDELSDWENKKNKFNKSALTDEGGNCYTDSHGELLLVLRIELDGEISGVYASKDNKKSQCFIKELLGVVLTRPPIAPVYQLIRVL